MTTPTPAEFDYEVWAKKLLDLYVVASAQHTDRADARCAIIIAEIAQVRREQDAATAKAERLAEAMGTLIDFLGDHEVWKSDELTEARDALAAYRDSNTTGDAT